MHTADGCKTEKHYARVGYIEIDNGKELIAIAIAACVVENTITGGRSEPALMKHGSCSVGR
jgi:hypothetical protein